jgi:hypothetical protein
MNAARLGTLCLTVVIAMSGTLRTQDQGPWWTWPTIDGNCGGYRDTLADHGLIFSGEANTGHGKKAPRTR